MNIKREYILCYRDISTGERYLSGFKDFDMLTNEILSLHIKEIIVGTDFNNIIFKDFCNTNSIVISYMDNIEISSSLSYITSIVEPSYHKAIGRLIQCFIKTQISSYLKPFKSYVLVKYLYFDAFTKKNLELCEILRFNNKSGFYFGYFINAIQQWAQEWNIN